MSISIYGDSIFEANLDILYNSVMESGKLFKDFDIVTEAESNLKDKIITAIKKVIEKVKKFFKWLKEKVLKFCKAAIDKIKSRDLKKKLDNLKQKIKNKSHNESAILTEATLEQLEDWLNNTTYDVYRIYISTSDGTIHEYIEDSDYKVHIHKNEKYFKWTRTFIRNEKVREYDLFVPVKVSVEEFLKRKDTNANDFQKVIELTEKYKSKCDEKIKELEHDLSKISQKDIRSSEDLIRALNDRENSNKLKTNIQLLNNSINEFGELINAATFCLNDLAKSVQNIDEKLSSDNDDTETYKSASDEFSKYFDSINDSEE